MSFDRGGATCLERDVRPVIAVRDLSVFQRFVCSVAKGVTSATAARCWVGGNWRISKLPNQVFVQL